MKNSIQNVIKWQRIRDYVLKNPTVDNINPSYSNLYFEMNNKIAGYSYKQNQKYDIVEMYMEPRFGYTQVSDQACDLPIILSIPYVKDMFNKNKYSIRFEKNKYIMIIYNIWIIKK